MGFFKKPPHWKEYFTSYPNGFSLMEMLSDWASKANILKQDLDKKTDNTGDHKGTWHGLRPSQANESVASLVDKHSEELESLAVIVGNEEELRGVIEKGFRAVSLKNDMVLANPIDIDGFTLKINLNGFKIILSDSYSQDYIFSTGRDEFWDNPSGHERTSKYIFNGFIDCNNKNVFVIKHHFSWDLKCWNLRVERCGLGFIGYWPESDNLPTRGAEVMFDNITVISSPNANTLNIGFDINIGDGIFTRLFAHYFAIGIRCKQSGTIFDNCHVWGLPENRPTNHRMRVCYYDEGYGNTWSNCLADTPALVNPSRPASESNGGIGFYSQNSISGRFINCELMLSSASVDNSIHFFHFNNPNHPQTDFHGSGITLIGCNIRSRWEKINKAVFFEGERPFTMLACNFNFDKRTNQHNVLPSNSLHFKFNTKEVSTDESSLTSPPKNTFKFNPLNNVMHIQYRDNKNKLTHYFIKPFVSNRMSISQLRTLKTQLVEEKRMHGEIDRTGSVTTTLAIWDSGQGKTVLDLVFWDMPTEDFYYAKNGEKVIL